MPATDTLAARVAVLERRTRRLTMLAVALGTLSLAAAVRPAPDVLRTEGLVIVDAKGRQRVVIGAPLDGVASHAGSAATIGMIVYDSVGRPVTAIGANTPNIGRDGRVAPRVSDAVGMTFYDPRNGRERGGIGAFADGRANVCLDYGEGRDKEAACMAVAPGDQYAAVILNGMPNEDDFDRVVMYVGADGSGSIKAMGGGANRNGIMLRAGSGPLNAVLFDSAGNGVERRLP